jgi:hypothetical protein
MQQISPLNNLMLWLMVSGILASMLAKNEFTIGMSTIKDAVMDMVRILFVAAWIGMLLMQATIVKRGLEGGQIDAIPDPDASSFEVK